MFLTIYSKIQINQKKRKSWRKWPGEWNCLLNCQSFWQWKGEYYGWLVRIWQASVKSKFRINNKRVKGGKPSFSGTCLLLFYYKCSRIAHHSWKRWKHQCLSVIAQAACTFDYNPLETCQFQRSLREFKRQDFKMKLFLPCLGSEWHHGELLKLKCTNLHPHKALSLSPEFFETFPFTSGWNINILGAKAIWWVINSTLYFTPIGTPRVMVIMTKKGCRTLNPML